MQDIRDWLTHKDYVEGIRIYLKHGRDTELKKLLTSEHRTPFKEQRLERALREVLKGHEVIEEKEKPVLSIMKTWPADAVKDDVVAALRAEWLTKFKEMQDLRSQLMLLPTDEARGEAALKILDLDEACDEIYARRDYYLQHGRLPDVEPTQQYVVNPLKAAERMSLLAGYIRRERNYLKKNPANAKAAARRAKFIEEYNHYAKKFGRAGFSEAGEPYTATQE